MYDKKLLAKIACFLPTSLLISLCTGDPSSFAVDPRSPMAPASHEVMEKMSSERRRETGCEFVHADKTSHSRE